MAFVISLVAEPFNDRACGGGGGGGGGGVGAQIPPDFERGRLKFVP